jgi:hypothetical protein
MIRADKPFVTVEVRHIVRGQQDDVVFGGVQVTIGTVNHACLRECDPAFGLEICDHELVPLAGVGLRGSCLGQKGRRHQQQKEKKYSLHSNFLAVGVWKGKDRGDSSIWGNYSAAGRPAIRLPRGRNDVVSNLLWEITPFLYNEEFSLEARSVYGGVV